MKVLVVDDNRLLAATIQEILEDNGLEVRSANDGVDGYSAYLLFKPDVANIFFARKGIKAAVPAVAATTLSKFLRSLFISFFLLMAKNLKDLAILALPFKIEHLSALGIGNTPAGPLSVLEGGTVGVNTFCASQKIPAGDFPTPEI